MEKDKLVLGLLESYLGSGKKSGKHGDYSFSCPFCRHHKPKLIINVQTGQYNCWTCHPATKGKTPVSLLKRISAPIEHIKEMADYFEVSLPRLDQEIKTQTVSLPSEFVSLINPQNTVDIKRALSYLKSRKISQSDIQKYNIGYCSTGKYQDRIIIPSYDKNGVLNYFVARSLDNSAYIKYDTPECKKNDLIGMESLINWSVPVILCEGAFDAIAIKRNAIPLFGKTIPNSVMMKLVESEVKTIYLALDNDALKEAIDLSEQFLNYGKEVYMLDLKGKDPSKIGFENMIKLLHLAEPLTFTNLFRKKMELA